MSNLLPDCNECRFLSLTEEQQIDKRIPHMCKIHLTRVFHRSATKSYLWPCFECNGNDFIKRS
jgi:hypothetical protein